MLHLVGFIFTGFVVGLVARALKPGDDSMSVGMTILLGITGALLAGYVGRAFGWYGPDEGAGFVLSTIGAMVLISAYYGLTHRKRIRH